MGPTFNHLFQKADSSWRSIETRSVTRRAMNLSNEELQEEGMKE
jgi:hypothetical protein